MKKKWIAAGAVLAVLAAAYLILCAAVDDEVIWKAVSINGVPVKGLSVEEAGQQIQEDFRKEYGEASVRVRLDGQEFEIPVFPALGLDPSGELEEAYRMGHRLWILQGADWFMNKIHPGKPQELEVFPEVMEPDKLEQAMEASGILDYDSHVETSWEQIGTDLVIHMGTSGAAADGEQLKEQLVQVIEGRQMGEELQCPVAETHPELPDLKKIADELYRDPVDAALSREAGYEIQPSSPGISLDIEAAQAACAASAEGTDVVVPLTVTQPDITTEDMEENLFRDELGSYQSRVTGDAGKKHNISLAAGFCDEVILLPGETFSYNEHIGNTTLERGFELANAYQDGDVVKEPGGGVCQVSSTIYSAVLQTDLEVIQRRFHSMIVTYVPYGMDATVSWPEPDFKFQNNHQYPIKLSVKYENDVVSVQIIGTKESDITVKCVVEQTGELSYKTYREYYDGAGNLVEREYIDSSRYKPLP